MTKGPVLPIFRQYLWAVCKHWYWVVSSVVLAVWDIAERSNSSWYTLPRLLLVSGALVCVFVAQFLAYLEVTKASKKMEIEIAELKAHPVFSDHVYQFNIHPRTGITPPKMLQEALDIFADRNKKPKTELKVDCDVFIEVCVVNEVPAVGTVAEYELEVERDGQSIKLKNEPGFLGWNQMRTPYRVDPVTGEKVAEGPKCEDVPDLMDLTRRPMQQGHSIEGWLHFVMEQINPLTLETNPIKLKKLTVVDCYGTRHDIAKGWIGERQTAIAPDVMPANLS